MQRILITLLALGACIPLAAGRYDDPNPPADVYDATHRFVFFAVLEGCYQDGLSSEEIDLIVPPAKGDREMTVNFVYSCPLCHPAFEAFRIYGSRRPFHGQKGTRYDTFGQGLDVKLKAKLRGEDVERRKAIKALISRWVTQRADLLRLTAEERKVLMADIEAKQKKGEAALKHFIEQGEDSYYGAKYAGWKECAICSGAAGAPMGIDAR